MACWTQQQGNFYDGRVGIMSPDGTRVGTYAPAEYRDWIAEHVEPWTYLNSVPQEGRLEGSVGVVEAVSGVAQ